MERPAELTLLQKKLLQAARFAPSPHNTQPWQINFKTDGLDVHLRSPRLLPAVDPENFDILHALGALAENLMITLQHHGFLPQLKIHQTIDAGEPIFSLSWKRMEGTHAHSLYPWLAKRATSRLPYDAVPVDASLLGALRADLEFGFRLAVATDPSRIETIRKAAACAASRQTEDSKISAELYHWLRFWKKDSRWFQDGLTAEAMGWRSVESMFLSVLLHPRTLRVIKFLRLTAFLFDRPAAIVPATGAICLLLAPPQAPSKSTHHRIHAGRVLQRLWLTIASHGLHTHPIQMALDFPDTRQAVFQALDVEPSRLPIVLFRLGISPPPQRSHRLPAAALVAAEKPGEASTSAAQRRVLPFLGRMINRVLKEIFSALIDPFRFHRYPQYAGSLSIHCRELRESSSRSELKRALARNLAYLGLVQSLKFEGILWLAGLSLLFWPFNPWIIWGPCMVAATFHGLPMLSQGVRIIRLLIRIWCSDGSA